MSLRVTCPNCCETYPIDAGFADDDGKRLAALVAGVEPVLGRAIISYLRLFKPPKTSLRTTRAVKIVEDLLALVRTGTVCPDERGAVRRPASPAVWAAGIEQMLAAPGTLGLPLANHNYLRKVVHSVANEADASAERQREANARVGNRPSTPSASSPRESRLDVHLKWLREQLECGRLSETEHDEQAAAARITIGGAS